MEEQNKEKEKLDKAALKAKKKKASQYYLCTVRQKKCESSEFVKSFELLKDMTDVDALMAEIRETIHSQGRVFAVKKKKQYVAVYVLDHHENYFAEEVDVNQSADPETVEKHEKTLKKWCAGNKSALVLKRKVVADEVKDVIDLFEKDVFVHLKDFMTDNIHAGYEWEGKVYYRKYLKADKEKGFPLTPLFFAVCGFMMGWLLFDNIALGISFALMYGVCLGGAFISEDKFSIEVKDLKREEE